MTPIETILEQLRHVGDTVCDHVWRVLDEIPPEERSRITRKTGADVIYRIDEDAEAVILDQLAGVAGSVGGITLIAEGIGDDAPVTLPASLPPGKTAWRVIIDPIDGTRMIMVDKRSAFFLAGVAPNRGHATSTADIEAAVMVELPTRRGYLSDHFWAIRGGGARGETRNLFTGERSPRAITPSTETEILGGFASFIRFFPPEKEVMTRIEADLLEQLYPNPKPGEIITFEDQYISSGGQLYELLTGKDRFVADLRHHLYRSPHRTRPAGHICHPYDLAAHLIGEEAGIIITGADGSPFNAPLDTTSPADWIGYANSHVFDQVHEPLQALLRTYELV